MDKSRGIEGVPGRLALKMLGRSGSRKALKTLEKTVAAAQAPRRPRAAAPGCGQA